MRSGPRTSWGCCLLTSGQSWFLGSMHWYMESGPGPSHGQHHVPLWLWGQNFLRQLLFAGCWGYVPTQLVAYPEALPYWCPHSGGQELGCVLKLISSRVLVSTSVCMVEQQPPQPKMAVTTVFVPKVKKWLPTSLGDPPRSVGGPDPGFFQIISSTLGPRACEI